MSFASAAPRRDQGTRRRTTTTRTVEPRGNHVGTHWHNTGHCWTRPARCGPLRVWQSSEPTHHRPTGVGLARVCCRDKELLQHSCIGKLLFLYKRKNVKQKKKRERLGDVRNPFAFPRQAAGLLIQWIYCATRLCSVLACSDLNLVVSPDGLVRGNHEGSCVWCLVPAAANRVVGYSYLRTSGPAHNLSGTIPSRLCFLSGEEVMVSPSTGAGVLPKLAIQQERVCVLPLKDQ